MAAAHWTCSLLIFSLREQIYAINPWINSAGVSPLDDIMYINFSSDLPGELMFSSMITGSFRVAGQLYGQESFIDVCSSITELQLPEKTG